MPVLDQVCADRSRDVDRLGSRSGRESRAGRDRGGFVTRLQPDGDDGCERTVLTRRHAPGLDGEGRKPFLRRRPMCVPG